MDMMLAIATRAGSLPCNTFESRSGGSHKGGTQRQEGQGPHHLFFSPMTLSNSNSYTCKIEENLSNLEHLGHTRRSWHALCRPCRLKGIHNL